MSLLGWVVGLGIADSLLDDAEEEREELERKNEELEREQRRLRGRIEELEREAKWGKGDYS